MEMIINDEVYEINDVVKHKGKEVVRNFSTVINGKEHGLTTTYTHALSDEIKKHHDLSVSDILQDILKHELFFEIFCKVHDVSSLNEIFGNDELLFKYVEDKKKNLYSD